MGPEADKASLILAIEKGPCPDALELGIKARFSHKLAIAPTASISIICGGTSACVEPIPANIYTHKTLSGSFTVKNKYLEYLLENKIMLFPWSSQARGFFIEKKEITSNEHFSNPSLEEEKRVWHSDKNLKRREACFDIAKRREVQPIQVALAYVIQKSS